jgi:putative ABC transport system substrate-binding protein
MQRRRALGALLVSPLAARAAAQQPGKVYRVGYLSHPTRASVERGVGAFEKALRDLGWVEGQNLVTEYRWAEGDVDRLPGYAKELVDRKVDLIVAPAGTAARAAKNATSTIPIVMIFPPAPVEMGLVASLNHPGGNVTGTSFAPGFEIFGKQVQLLKETLPRMTRVAALRNPADQLDGQIAQVESAARALGLALRYADATGPDQFARAFESMARDRAEASVVFQSSMFLAHRESLADRALKARLPTMFSYREQVEAGGLMAYGVNMSAFIGRAAAYVDKILRGAKPADLPVEQPTKFELVVNLKTASALRLTIPPLVLQQADDRIE